MKAAKIIVLFLTLVFSITVFAATRPKVLLKVIPSCVYCAQAKNILNSHGIAYKTTISYDGPVPQLYVDGKYKGVGVDAVETWVKQNQVRR